MVSLSPFHYFSTLSMWSCMRWVIGARTPCVSPPCNSHLLHAHRHTHIHTDPITGRHHLDDCPGWPFILSWAVAEQPYTSADFWLTGREDTPTWSPFSSSTTAPSPQKPLPAPSSSPRRKHTWAKVFQSRKFPREKRFRLGSPCTAAMEGVCVVCVCVCVCVRVFEAGSGSWGSRERGVFGG